MRQFGDFMVSKEYYMDSPYKICWVPDWSDWREHHIAHLTAFVQEVPEVRATADTAEEAVELLHAAFSEWLDLAISEGRDIPKPEVLD